MRTSDGASTPSRTWLPFTSSTRTVTVSPTRMTSPNFRVSTSMARALRVDSTRHYRPGAGYALDSAQIRQRRPCGRLLREEFPEELPQHAARDVGGIRVVLPGLHGGAQAPDELA